MKSKRHIQITVIMSAVLIIVAIMIIFLLGDWNNKKLKLPDADSVLSISINQYNDYTPVGEIIITDRTEINNILSTMSGAAKTMKVSVNDYPAEEKYLIIRLYLENEMRTLCLYTSSTDYIEEPYVGIYRSKKKFDYVYSVYSAYEFDNRTTVNGATLPLEMAPLLEISITEDELSEQRIEAVQLTTSWSVFDENGGGIRYEADSMHPLKLDSYDEITLKLNKTNSEIILYFSNNYPPKLISIQRWDAEHIGTDMTNIWANGEPIVINKNKLNIDDDGHNYIYEVYAKWEQGSSHYAFRIDCMDNH